MVVEFCARLLGVLIDDDCPSPTNTLIQSYVNVSKGCVDILYISSYLQAHNNINVQIYLKVRFKLYNKAVGFH